VGSEGEGGFGVWEWGREGVGGLGVEIGFSLEEERRDNNVPLSEKTLLWSCMIRLVFFYG
jgi:hypothetical protein